MGKRPDHLASACFVKYLDIIRIITFFLWIELRTSYLPVYNIFIFSLTPSKIENVWDFLSFVLSKFSINLKSCNYFGNSIYGKGDILNFLNSIFTPFNFRQLFLSSQQVHSPSYATLFNSPKYLKFEIFSAKCFLYKTKNFLLCCSQREPFS